MSSKLCKRCCLKKRLSDFSTKFDKRDGRTYYHNLCKPCNAEASHERYLLRKDNEDYKAYKRKKALEYHVKYRETCLQQMKEYRQSDSAKKTRKDYIIRNKSKIYQQEVICKKRYIDKHKEALSDMYVVAKLCGKDDGHMREVFYKTPELIEAKRNQLKIKRIINNQKP